MAQGKPGRDYIFNITVKDDNGDPQDLTTVQGLALIAFTKPKKIIEQWSLNTVSGFEPMVAVDLSAGQVKIQLAASKTKAINEDMVYIEPITQVDDVDFGAIDLSSKDGLSYELIKITNTPKNEVEDLS